MDATPKRGLLIFGAFILIITIGYRILEKSDIDKTKMKISLFNQLKEKNLYKSSDDQITYYVDSLCNYLFIKYKNRRKIPAYTEMDSTDIEVLLKFTINNLISDSIEKQLYRSNFEEIKRNYLLKPRSKDSAK
jgi:hypothetical protein